MAEPTQENLGRYQLLAQLASGGMAEIYLARQTGLRGFERLVAVKRILPHLLKDEVFVDMFLDEARIAAQLSHPNIVQIFDLGEEDGQYFIAMEYLEGESLGYLVSEALKAGQILPPVLAASIVARVCDGLDYAHKLPDDSGKHLGLVHRDVSPQNIIILFSGGVKLIDFGIAKAASQVHRTQVGTLKGKVNYMSPEQCKGASIDGRSDVFGLGIVFWELLTRRRLFKKDNEAAVINAIINEDAPGIRTIRPELSSDLEAIVGQALRRDPAKRFQSTAAMATAIRAHMRATRAAADAQEIAAFVHGVFGDRARTKSQLLEQIRTKGTDEISVAALKPPSEASIPSGTSQSPAPPDTIPESEAAQDPQLDSGAWDPTRIRDDSMPAPTDSLPEQPVEDSFFQEDYRPTEPGGLPIAEQIHDTGDQIPRSLLKKKPARSKMPWIVLALVVVGVGAGGGAWWWTQHRAPEPTDPAPLEQPVATEEPRSTEEPGPVETTPEPALPVDAGVAPGDPDPMESTAAKGDEKKAAAVEAPKPAILAISSRPSACLVRVDGKPITRKTPLIQPVKADRDHSVVVLCPGYLPQTKWATGAPGDEVALAFTPKKKPDPGTKPPKPPKASTGTLMLDTDPWSEVYFGQRKLGMTPVLGAKLPAGKHTLRLKNEGLGIDKKIQVVIEPGKKTKLRMKIP